MARGTILHRLLGIGMVTGIFAAGFLCGSLTQRSANAQLEQLGGDVLKQAAGGGGPLGTAAELGTTIVDMEQHVSGLQKNIDVLKKVKAALGG
jgi:hypothetical protein